MKSNFSKVRKRAGTSLVEILVVIVVLLVGILAIVQIFPGGFRVLSATQNNSIATALARAEIELLKNHADQLPDAIVPVRYTFNSGTVAIDVQPDKYPDDLGPSLSSMDAQGNMLDASSNIIGSWQFLTGANIGRRVLGEGKAIPAPKQVGIYYGSLLELQFAPIIFNPTYKSLFAVYGNDMARRSGDPVASGFGVRPTEFWIANEDGAGANITLPSNATRAIRYRLQMSIFVSGGTGNDNRRDLVDIIQDVPAGGGPWQKNISQLGDVQTYLVANSLTFQGVEYESIRCSRAFEDLSSLAADDWGLGSGIANPDPYYFKLISPERGLVLFNPAGYNYMVRGNRGARSPLLGRVSYDVYDWRIIHEEFRLPEQGPAQFRLAIGSIKVQHETGPDGLPNAGIGIQAPTMTSGSPANADLVLEDVATGGLYAFQENTQDPSKTSYSVNKLNGLVTFIDQDTITPGTQMTLYRPGVASGALVTVDHRIIRALYMGKKEFAVQVMKPAAVFTETWTRPGASQFYLGGSDSGADGNASRIYFAPAEAGRVVSVGELYYTNTAGIQVGPVQLTAKLETGVSDGTFGSPSLPYIQVPDYLPDFAGFDYSYGAAAKSVKGASVAVRVLWNPDFFQLSGNSNSNMTNLQTWMQGWRRSTVETYLQRGS